MPASALALVLVAALLHAIWNLAAKRAGGGPHFALASAIGVTVVWLLPVAWVGFSELPRWSLTTWGCVLASAVLHLAYFNCLLTGYRLSDLTVVYPVARGSGPLISALAAVLLFGEYLGLAGGLGLAGVVGGIFLITLGPTLRRGTTTTADAARRRRLGLLWGAATGGLIASYTLLDGYAVKVLAVSPIMLDYFGNVLRVPLMLAPLMRRPAEFKQTFMSELRRTWPAVLTMAVLSPLAYILVLYAMLQAPLSRVAPARELSMLFAALLGGQLLGEGERGWRIAGAACIAMGVMALAL
jgi:drug/metabolite transporter (DMT)-like permease